KHPHELLDSVVKEQLVKSFVSTEAANSTAAFVSVKLFFEVIFWRKLFQFNSLDNPQLHLFSFGEARILQHLVTPSSCF
ncbi:hypothetical protein ACSVIJ_18035, partial [Pseudomonas sp. NCHU5208]